MRSKEYFRVAGKRYYFVDRIEKIAIKEKQNCNVHFLDGFVVLWILELLKFNL